MTLIVQIQSLCYSFLFGLFASLLFNLCYKVLFYKNIFIRILFNLIFCITLYVLYFYLLYKINNGILHLYFFMMLFIGFYIYNRIFVKIRVK